MSLYSNQETSVIAWWCIRVYIPTLLPAVHIAAAGRPLTHKYTNASVLLTTNSILQEHCESLWCMTRQECWYRKILQNHVMYNRSVFTFTWKVKLAIVTTAVHGIWCMVSLHSQCYKGSVWLMACRHYCQKHWEQGVFAVQQVQENNTLNLLDKLLQDSQTCYTVIILQYYPVWMTNHFLCWHWMQPLDM